MKEKPLNMFEQSTKPGERITDKPELPPQGFAMHMVADTESIEGEAHLKLDSDEPLDKIVALVRNAKGGCFAENLVVQQVPLLSSVTLRGQTIEFKENS